MKGRMRQGGGEGGYYVIKITALYTPFIRPLDCCGALWYFPINRIFFFIRFIIRRRQACERHPLILP